jgi:hypothetical protein
MGEGRDGVVGLCLSCVPRARAGVGILASDVRCKQQQEYTQAKLCVMYVCVPRAVCQAAMFCQVAACSRILCSRGSHLSVLVLERAAAATEGLATRRSKHFVWCYRALHVLGTFRVLLSFFFPFCFEYKGQQQTSGAQAQCLTVHSHAAVKLAAWLQQLQTSVLWASGWRKQLLCLQANGMWIPACCC